MRDVGVHSCGTIRPRRGGRRPGGGAGRRASRNPPRSTSSSRGSPAPASWSSAPCTHTRASHEWGLEECRATSDAWCTTPPWWGTMTCLQHGRDTPWKPVVASTSDFGVGRGESDGRVGSPRGVPDPLPLPIIFRVPGEDMDYRVAIGIIISNPITSHHSTAPPDPSTPRIRAVARRRDGPSSSRLPEDLTIW